MFLQRFCPLLATAIGILCASGCLASSPVATTSTNNTAIEVDLLFTHDGCQVYRFKDLGYHYFVRCDGASSASTTQTVYCGKGCRREEMIQTSQVASPSASTQPAQVK